MCPQPARPLGVEFSPPPPSATSVGFRVTAPAPAMARSRPGGTLREAPEPPSHGSRRRSGAEPAPPPHPPPASTRRAADSQLLCFRQRGTARSMLSAVFTASLVAYALATAQPASTSWRPNCFGWRALAGCSYVVHKYVQVERSERGSDSPLNGPESAGPVTEGFRQGRTQGRGRGARPPPWDLPSIPICSAILLSSDQSLPFVSVNRHLNHCSMCSKDRGYVGAPSKPAE